MACVPFKFQSLAETPAQLGPRASSSGRSLVKYVRPSMWPSLRPSLRPSLTLNCLNCSIGFEASLKSGKVRNPRGRSAQILSRSHLTLANVENQKEPRRRPFCSISGPSIQLSARNLRITNSQILQSRSFQSPND